MLHRRLETHLPTPAPVIQLLVAASTTEQQNAFALHPKTTVLASYTPNPELKILRTLYHALKNSEAEQHPKT